MSVESLLSTRIGAATSLSDPKYDGVIIVSHDHKHLANNTHLSVLAKSVEEYGKSHGGIDKPSTNLIILPKDTIPSGRLVYASTGSVSKDFDDVRKFKDAAISAVKMARDIGIKRPLFATLPSHRFKKAELVSAIAALNALYTPLNLRDLEKDSFKAKFDEINFLGTNDFKGADLTELAAAIGYSMSVCNDIGDSDPIRMTPQKTLEYVQQIFGGPDCVVKVTSVSDVHQIEKDYPCLAAVDRANECDSHRARLIKLQYNDDQSNGQAKETLLLCGKGVTLDTGGLNIKVGANMKGMCRDKTGSATVAAFFAALNILKPKNLKVIGYMCMVRNSVGPNAYSSDEIITSRSKKRIHIYNTDAEGRMAMLDPLTEFREMAVNEVNPHIYTFATLTGHEVMCYGEYAALMDNGPAKASNSSLAMQAVGDEYGQPVEISRIQPEDFTTHDAEFEGADICQLSTKHSPKRGHQGAFCFLARGSLLDQHQTCDPQPIKYTHVDMAGPNGNYPKNSYPNPLVTLIGHHILPRCD
uniref:CYTOSOL_AP domain-containing protein n=1 Tax=Rhabditophanes sp. KR3021 TaxID=114890 RepID=A0AC35TP58_9BILA